MQFDSLDASQIFILQFILDQARKYGKKCDLLLSLNEELIMGYN